MNKIFFPIMATAFLWAWGYQAQKQPGILRGIAEGIICLFFTPVIWAVYFAILYFTKS
jgi:hypothetical protein